MNEYLPPSRFVCVVVRVVINLGLCHRHLRGIPTSNLLQTLDRQNESRSWIEGSCPYSMLLFPSTQPNATPLPSIVETFSSHGGGCERSTTRTKAAYRPVGS